MSLNIVGLLCGTAFGFILGWARLTDYDVIHNMLLLREPDVFLLMMSGIATATIGVRALRFLKVKTILDGATVDWKVERPRTQHVIGSALFGLGWSVAATCPGPVAAQLGRGQFVGLFTIAGLLIGIRASDRLHGRSSLVVQPAPRDGAAVVGL